VCGSPLVRDSQPRPSPSDSSTGSQLDWPVVNPGRCLGFGPSEGYAPCLVDSGGLVAALALLFRLASEVIPVAAPARGFLVQHEGTLPQTSAPAPAGTTIHALVATKWSGMSDCGQANVDTQALRAAGHHKQWVRCAFRGPVAGGPWLYPRCRSEHVGLSRCIARALSGYALSGHAQLLGRPSTRARVLAAAISICTRVADLSDDGSFWLLSFGDLDSPDGIHPIWPRRSVERKHGCLARFTWERCIDR
jgi:hypothetical protein